MNMGEHIGLFGIGSIIGFVGVVLAQPVWLLLLIAFGTGAMTYAGKWAIESIRKYFSAKSKE